MFQKGDLVKLRFPRHVGSFSGRWRGLFTGDLGVVLGETGNHKWSVYFPAGQEEKTQEMPDYWLKKVEKVNVSEG